MLGGDYSTKLSPWLALGCLSPRHVYYEVKQYERKRKANKSTYCAGQDTFFLWILAAQSGLPICFGLLPPIYLKLIPHPHVPPVIWALI